MGRKVVGPGFGDIQNAVIWTNHLEDTVQWKTSCLRNTYCDQKGVWVFFRSPDAWLTGGVPSRHYFHEVWEAIRFPNTRSTRQGSWNSWSNRICSQLYTPQKCPRMEHRNCPFTYTKCGNLKKLFGRHCSVEKKAFLRNIYREHQCSHLFRFPDAWCQSPA